MPSQKQRNNRRLLTAALLFVLLFSAMAGTCSVKPATAENTAGEIILHSPERRTYTKNDVLLNLTITGQGYVLGHGGGLFSDRLESRYTLEFLDAPSGVKLVSKRIIALSDTGDGYAGNVTWSDLSEGAYNLTVYAAVYRNMLSFESRVWAVSKTALFAVDSTPTYVSVLSPDNTTYDSSDVILSFTVNDPVSRVVCKVDGEYLNVAGNTTLTALNNGEHSLTVYVTDRVGGWVKSQSVHFTVVQHEEQGALDQTLIFIAAVALAAIISFGLVAYFLHRKRRCPAS
jgi:hypothetical protein